MVEKVFRKKRFFCSVAKEISTKIYGIYLLNFGMCYGRLTRRVDVGSGVEPKLRCN